MSKPSRLSAAVLCYNVPVLSGSIRLAIASCRKAVATVVRKPIPIDKTKRCKAIVQRNVGSFNADGTEAEATRTNRVPLSVFLHGLPTASLGIGERPFPFSDDCWKVCIIDADRKWNVHALFDDVDSRKHDFGIMLGRDGRDWGDLLDI